MTDFEKKLKRYHNKKVKYNQNSEALINRLRRKEAEKYDFAEDRDDIGYSMLDKKYSYPIRLFDKSKIEQLITDLNDISDKKISHSEVIDSSIFDFSKKNTIKNFIRFICILFIILLFILLFKK